MGLLQTRRDVSRRVLSDRHTDLEASQLLYLAVRRENVALDPDFREDFVERSLRPEAQGEREQYRRYHRVTES